MARGPSTHWTAFHRRCAVVCVVACGVAAVAVTPVVWAASQDAPGDHRWWLLAAGAALLAAVGASLPLFREVSSAGYLASCVVVAVLLTLALGTVFATAQTVHDVRLRLDEPRSVPATLTACRVTGRALDDENKGHDIYGCTYRWTADDRTFSEERPTDKLFADGHRTTVLLDGGRMITGRPSLLAIPFWIVLALVGLLGTVRITAVVYGRGREEGLLR
ncbi:hypothetical protein OH807_02185 [Kitasatospora sp. NBC_01560]|uniref:hypothetical protein n=1 Tax=Kitasatospora sp. NBC_01560 TaxID=2975965 RepID=UPI003864AE1A